MTKIEPVHLENYYILTILNLWSDSTKTSAIFVGMAVGYFKRPCAVVQRINGKVTR